MNAPREEIPKKVGRYQIVEAIGFGAMGAVYKAFDPLIKRSIAIKTIRLDIPPQNPHYRTFIGDVPPDVEFGVAAAPWPA